MNEFTRIAMELADEMVFSGAGDASKFSAARSALLAHLEGGEQKWRPIETAPKDGSTILLGYLSGNPHIANYSEEGRWMGDASRNHWGETGWFATSDDVLCDHPSEPDLWMHLPLPATPTSEASK